MTEKIAVQRLFSSESFPALGAIERLGRMGEVFEDTRVWRACRLNLTQGTEIAVVPNVSTIDSLRKIG